MKTYKCKLCGQVFEVEDGKEPECPLCHAKGDKLEEVKVASNPYAGSQTEKNLEAAFAGESMARNKYTYFASQAKKEGFNQIADIFEETARNEKEHAKLWYKLINGGSVSETIKNLKEAAEGEHFEWSKMYKEFAAIARKEGFEEIAIAFEGVAEVEAVHEKRYLKLLALLKAGKVFNRDKKVVWKCDNCGKISYGKKAPKVCPVCHHPEAYHQVKCDCTFSEEGCQCTTKKCCK